MKYVCLLLLCLVAGCGQPGEGQGAADSGPAKDTGAVTNVPPANTGGGLGGGHGSSPSESQKP